ncbi:MAG: L-serine ammonia-lyase, iron-sulfur-dependent, subunit alpha [bacterium]|nr:L-serine ammonia-lyase, iron-sulfur-dependent, subunit alpha [bacterium]
MDEQMMKRFLAILREELVPAMGCTEPIALAYAAARARETLGETPTRLTARCSGNMVKNVRCVQIPNSGGLIGIEAAVALGALAGDASRGMEVLEAVDDAGRSAAREMLERGGCAVSFLDSEIPLHFIIEAATDAHTATVEVRYAHTNLYAVTRDGEVLSHAEDGASGAAHTGRSELTVDRIRLFADEVPLEWIRPIIEKQIRCNMDIAYEGMAGDYGLGIGRVIRSCYADSALSRMKAYAAAASEARMEGCDMPVIINSGSGNQGIASSVPVIVYARENNIPKEKLYRALAFSALLTIHQKEYIGKLSAFCGAVSASCASAAAVTYMVGGTIRQIKDTVDNTLANIPGIICDGAKASCAAKIASSLDAAMMAHYLAMQGKCYSADTGILKAEAEDTISCVGHIGKVGMRETDKEIIKLMLQ